MRPWLVFCFVTLFALAGCQAPADLAEQPEGEPEQPPEPAKETARKAPEPAESVDASSPVEPREPEVHIREIHWEFEAFAFLAGSTDWANETVEVDVPADATGVLVELDWDDPVQDVDPVLDAAHRCGSTTFQELATCSVGSLQFDGSGGIWWNDDGARLMPDHGARIFADADDVSQFRCDSRSGTCTWTASVWSRDIVQNMDMRLAVTVFYDDVPADYSAFA